MTGCLSQPPHCAAGSVVSLFFNSPVNTTTYRSQGLLLNSQAHPRSPPPAGLQVTIGIGLSLCAHTHTESSSKGCERVAPLLWWRAAEQHTAVLRALHGFADSQAHTTLTQTASSAHSPCPHLVGCKCLVW
jgi:hypothetical protein